MHELASVIIPAYNAERFIERTIESVLEQSYSNLEIIVINDGSKDSTLTILDHLVKQDKRIRLLNKNNTGVSDTRNKGIELAKGKYIAFLDADDVWFKDNLQRKVAILEENPSIHYVYSNMLQADENLQNQQPAPPGKDNNTLEDLLLWNGEVIPGPCSNLVIRKECLDSGIRFDTRLSTIADQHLCVQLASRYNGRLINEYLWIYRVIPGSMSKSLAVMEKDALAVYSIYEANNYFRSGSFKRKCFANMYLILSGSWFKNGRNFIKGSKYLMLALLKSPVFTAKTLFIKLLKKLQ